jgi:hypothetical protein
MVDMKTKIVLAASLGILVGVVVGYSPFTPPSSAPTAQLLMQQASQTNVIPATYRPAHVVSPVPLLTAILAGLVIALPVFLMARRKAG